MPLFEDQTAWLDDIIAEVRAGNHPVCGQAATGFGKTYTMAHFCRHCAMHKRTVMMVVHRQEIFLQTVLHIAKVWDEYKAEPNPQHRRMSFVCTNSLKNLAIDLLMDNGRASMFSSRAGIVIGMIDTLSARFRANPAKGKPREGFGFTPDYIIIDEAHHSPAPTWLRVVDWFRAGGSRVIGITATPERLDGTPLGAAGGGLYTTLVTGPSMLELIARKRLSKISLFAPKERSINTDGLRRKKNGEYDIPTLAKRASVIVGDAVEEYRTRTPGKKMLAFCVTIEHCIKVVDTFRAAGISADFVHGKMKHNERFAALEAFRTGSISILASRDLIGEGMDIPSVDGIIDLRSTQSRTVYMQHIGRALRVCEGKEMAYVLDHAGNAHRHGHPCDPIDWNFNGVHSAKPDDDSSSSGGGDSMKQCVYCQCFAMKHERECPNCNAPFSPLANVKDAGMHTPRLPRTVDGDLEEYGVDAGDAEWPSDESFVRWRRRQGSLRQIELQHNGVRLLDKDN